MHKFRLIARFYSGIFLADLFVTLSCRWLLLLYGAQAQKILGILFWYKVVTVVMIFYTFVYYHKNQLYYYQNLGITKTQLIVITSVFDFALWLFVIIFQMTVPVPAYLFNSGIGLVLIIYAYLTIKK